MPQDSFSSSRKANKSLQHPKCIFEARGKVKENMPTKERLLWRSAELIIRLFVSIQLQSHDKHLRLWVSCPIHRKRKSRVFQVSQEKSRNWHKPQPLVRKRVIKCKWLRVWWATCEFIKLNIIAAATMTNLTWAGWLLSAETVSESFQKRWQWNSPEKRELIKLVNLNGRKIAAGGNIDNFNIGLKLSNRIISTKKVQYQSRTFPCFSSSKFKLGWSLWVIFVFRNWIRLQQFSLMFRRISFPLNSS